MAEKVNGRKRKCLELPVCKYGISCYQKNPDHHKRFRHPPAIESNNLDESAFKTQSLPREMSDDSAVQSLSSSSTENAEPMNDESFSEQTEVENIPRPPSPKNIKDNIKEKFLVEMPPDFYDMWEFTKKVHKKDPSEAFAEAGLHLVGPYDVLSKKISNKDIVSDNILCHWRYYYDPPEFQTVIKRDGKAGYHIGYFRDDPSEMPFGLASNSATVGPKLTLMGDNIFCAIYLELASFIKKAKTNKEKFSKIQENLEKFAKKRKYSLKAKSEITKARNNNTVSKTFHGYGIVVPIEREIGYRPLPDSDANSSVSGSQNQTSYCFLSKYLSLNKLNNLSMSHQLMGKDINSGISNATVKAILSEISDCESGVKKLAAREPLDEILTNVQFANDECDYGMGLELGIDLFCFGDPYLHNDIRFILPLAYDLLNRSEYGRIIQAHLKNRRKGDNLSIKD